MEFLGVNKLNEREVKLKNYIRRITKISITNFALFADRRIYERFQKLSVICYFVFPVGKKLSSIIFFAYTPKEFIERLKD